MPTSVTDLFNFCLNIHKSHFSIEFADERQKTTFFDIDLIGAKIIV